MKESIKKVNCLGDTRGLHPNSQKNLRPEWKPGQAGNPKGFSLTARMKLLMKEVCPYDAKGRTWEEVIAEAALRQALDKTEALKNLQDRIEGKVALTIGGSGEAIRMIHEWVTVDAAE